MQIFHQYLIVVLIASVAFGAFAQIGQFCLLGGLRAYFKKQSSHRLMAYFVAMTVALLASSLIEYNQWIDLSTTKPPYRSVQFAYGRYILGGLIFGVGMVLSSGCGMRNLIKVGQGSLQALIVVAVMSFSAYAMINLSVYSDIFLPIVKPLTVEFQQAGSQDIASLLVQAQQTKLTRVLIAAVLLLMVAVWSLRNRIFRQKRYILSAIGIGLIIAIGFYITGSDFGQLLIEESEFMDEPVRGLATQSFSFASPMADTIYVLWYREGMSVITFGVVAVVGLPIGAFLSSIIRKEFKLSGFSSVKDTATNIVGAILVGIGSVLAMGCTIGHGLTGISTLALGSFLALIFIILGALVTIKIKN